MMRIRISARQLFGDGSTITCKRCDHRILLPKNPNLIMYDDGKQSVVRDPADRSLRHRCGRKLEWFCPSCKEINEPRLTEKKTGRRSTRSMDITCPNCGDQDLIQREVLVGQRYK